MSFAAGPFFASAVILVVSGLAKVRSPRPAAAALGAVGLPVPAPLVGVLACTEAALGVTALVVPTAAVAAALAAAYVCFAVVACLFVWSPRVRSCGCLGEREIPPSVVHVLMNVAAAVTALAAAAAGPRSLMSVVVGLGWAGPAFVLGIAAIAYLASAVVSLYPAAFGAYRGRHDHGRERGGRSAARLRRTEEALREAGVEAGHASLWGGARPEAAG